MSAGKAGSKVRRCELMKRFFCLLCLVLMAATACVATGPKEVLYSVQLPDQWRRVDTDELFMMTKDGPSTQYILVQQRSIEEPFTHTKRMFNKSMLPQEAAEVVLDEIASDRAVLNFNVVENRPAKLNRYDGFKVIFTYRTENGLGYKTIYYGFLKDNWFFSVRYNVSVNHESTQNLEAFQKVLNSFELEGA
jgi:hypothetical protein